MSQTQLASMFLGNPYIDDRDERLRGVSSQLNSTIHILDGQSNQGVIIDYITAKNIIDDTHRKSLKGTLETYQFITFADKRFSQFLEKRNRVIIPDEDGSLVEFVIFEAHKYKDSEGHKAQVFSHASYLELNKASVLFPDDGFTGTASQHGGRALNNTGWQMGMVESSGTRTLTISNHTNPYEMLKRIAKEFDLELRFRIEHDGNKVIGRYVDLLERVGEWRGREVEFGKDLDGIRRVEKQDIVTALLGLGPEREDGTRLEVLVEDDEALSRWGWSDNQGNLNHLIEVYEIQSERTEMTLTQARQYTRTALDKRINTQVTFETTIIDLESVSGMENKKIRFGDTIKIKDTTFNPPLFLEARVFEQDRSIKSKAKKDMKLGDFVEFSEEEVHAIWTQLQAEIRKRVSIDQLKEYAEPKKIESDIPPVIKPNENPIWVDTSKSPKVPHVVIANEWQPMSHSDEVIKDASRLETGIIDVGAIPLRTSVTGARLEWDGANGLVQYNQNGDPVSWLDLDANAHFENAFLSGKIEALEGFFGDNLRLINGKLEIVRPDGAIAISDGLTRNSYSISENYPPYMTAGSVVGSGVTFNAFQPSGTYIQNGAHIFGGVKGSIDGRGLDNDTNSFQDVRDGLGAVAVQQYKFTHSTRYLVFRMQKYAGSKFSVHIVNNASDNISDRIYYELFETTVGGEQTMIIDLGTPLFNTRTVTFKIGWTNSWGGRMENVRFYIKEVSLTDYI